MSVEVALGLVSARVFRERLKSDYMLAWTELLPELIGRISKLGLTGPFWSPTGQ